MDTNRAQETAGDECAGGQHVLRERLRLPDERDGDGRILRSYVCERCGQLLTLVSQEAPERGHGRTPRGRRPPPKAG